MKDKQSKKYTKNVENRYTVPRKKTVRCEGYNKILLFKTIRKNLIHYNQEQKTNLRMEKESFINKKVLK